MQELEQRRENLPKILSYLETKAAEPEPEVRAGRRAG